MLSRSYLLGNRPAPTPPLRLDRPVVMRLELVERTRMPSLDAGLDHLAHVDDRTYEVKGATVREALGRL